MKAFIILFSLLVLSDQKIVRVKHTDNVEKLIFANRQIECKKIMNNMFYDSWSCNNDKLEYGLVINPNGQLGLTFDKDEIKIMQDTEFIKFLIEAEIELTKEKNRFASEQMEIKLQNNKSLRTIILVIFPIGIICILILALCRTQD